MIQLTGNGISLNELAQDHLRQLKYKKNKIDKWLNEKKRRDQTTRALVLRIQKNFDSLIISPVPELKQFITQLGPVEKKVSKEIQSLLGYNSFRKGVKARRFVKNLGVRACPYCNAQYIISLSRSGKLLCHFDHVFPKDIYPYLSLSFYNLIPCCSSCNQFKSYVDPLRESSYHHPFETSIADHFKFIATTSAIRAYRTKGRTESGVENIDIQIFNGRDIEFHIQTFRLKELYNEHNDVVDEIYFRALAYNPEYLEQLKNTFDLTDDEVNRVYFGTYQDQMDINKRPLTKFNQDLLSQFFDLQRR